MLPIGYLLRNLLRRRVRTVVTVGGIAATTLLVVAMSAFADGMHRAAIGKFELGKYVPREMLRSSR